MTTGLIYAALFYVASLILAVVIGFVFFPGDEMRALNIFVVAARQIGPLLIAPVGFIIGFSREQRKLRRLKEEEAQAERERLRQTQMIRMKSAQATPTPRPRGPQPTAETPSTQGNAPAQTQPTSTEDTPAPPQEEEQAGGRAQMSEEVREYLRQTSRVDLKGIKDFIEETRRYRVDDMEGEEKPS